MKRPKRSTVLERPATIAEFPVAMALIDLVAARIAVSLLRRHEAQQIEQADGDHADKRQHDHQTSRK